MELLVRLDLVQKELTDVKQQLLENEAEAGRQKTNAQVEKRGKEQAEKEAEKERAKNKRLEDEKKQRELEDAFRAELRLRVNNFSATMLEAQNALKKDECTTFKQAYNNALEIKKWAYSNKPFLAKTGYTLLDIDNLFEEVKKEARFHLNKRQIKRCFNDSDINLLKQ